MEQNSSIDIRDLNEKIANSSAFLDLLWLELGKTIVGQKYMIELFYNWIAFKWAYIIRRCARIG